MIETSIKQVILIVFEKNDMQYLDKSHLVALLSDFAISGLQR